MLWWWWWWLGMRRTVNWCCDNEEPFHAPYILIWVAHICKCANSPFTLNLSPACLPASQPASRLDLINYIVIRGNYLIFSLLLPGASILPAYNRYTLRITVWLLSTISSPCDLIAIHYPTHIHTFEGEMSTSPRVYLVPNKDHGQIPLYAICRLQ